jgi:hypothetical protein
MLDALPSIGLKWSELSQPLAMNLHRPSSHSQMNTGILDVCMALRSNGVCNRRAHLCGTRDTIDVLMLQCLAITVHLVSWSDRPGDSCFTPSGGLRIVPMHVFNMLF